MYKPTKIILAWLTLATSSIASAQWSYQNVEDPMRSTTTQVARLLSPTVVHLPFPYRGGSRLTLVLRKVADGDPEVMFQLSRGQLPCHASCTIAAKFDQDEVMTWPALGPDDGRSDVVFVEDGEYFVRLTRPARKLIVEVQVYDYGNVQFTFNTSGLKWK